MTTDFPIPQELARVDFTRLRCLLKFDAPFELTLEAFLRLRRSLLLAAQEVDQQAGNRRAAELIEPPEADDPVARRRFQRPAPAFVLRPPAGGFGPVAAGEVRELEVLFLGHGISGIAVFLETLRQLGCQGMFLHQGAFRVIRAEGLDAADIPQPLWSPGDLADLAPPVNEMRWWLESLRWEGRPQRLCFITPTRLLSAGRPLFEPDFEQMFPFILRRVTSMLYYHCDLELVTDPAPLLDAARQVQILERNLVWEDWRSLTGQQDLGGLLGTLTLSGEGLRTILWVLHLGELLQIGKGANYGAGCYRIEPV